MRIKNAELNHPVALVAFGERLTFFEAGKNHVAALELDTEDRILWLELSEKAKGDRFQGIPLESVRRFTPEQETPSTSTEAAPSKDMAPKGKRKAGSQTPAK